MKWTMRHAFFAGMGGYLLKARDFDAFPIQSNQLLYLIEERFLTYPEETEEDINDKNKRDSLAR